MPRHVTVTVCRHFSPTSGDIGDTVVAFNFPSFSSKWGLGSSSVSRVQVGGDEKRKREKMDEG